MYLSINSKLLPPYFKLLQTGNPHTKPLVGTVASHRLSIMVLNSQLYYMTRSKKVSRNLFLTFRSRTKRLSLTTAATHPNIGVWFPGHDRSMVGSKN